jgi:hypothetical protein
MTNLSTHLTFARLRETWQRLCRNHRSMGLEACPPTELHYPGPTQLMPRRLQQLGLDPDYVKVAQTATYQDLERVCAVCNAWRRCARDLAFGDVQAGMRCYCLNSATIDALTVDRLPELARIDHSAFATDPHVTVGIVTK